MKVNCAAKNTNCVQQIVQQSILNFKCFDFFWGGVLKNVLIGILVYLSDGIDTLLVEILLFYFDVR